METSESAFGPEVPAGRIDEGNLLANIWFKPTETLQFILANCPDKYVIGLMVLGGISRSIDRVSVQNMGDRMSTPGILVSALFAGGLFGWLTYYAYGWGLSVTGEWLGGRANPATYRTVLAWALVPTVVTMALVLPKAVLFGDELFKSKPAVSGIDNVLFILFECLDVILAIWALVILIKGIRLVQGFNIIRSFANLLLPGAIILGIVLVFAGLYKGLSLLLE